MRTRSWRVDPARPAAAVAKAAEIIRAGGVVAYPTETVYGLGADVLNAAAVTRVFAAKGRPPGKPLIVAVAAEEDLNLLVREIPAAARALMAAFWPGPLTLVLPRRAALPEVVSGGRDGVAVRMPAHPVALALIRAAGVPITTTSANLAGRHPPVTAEEVERQLSGRIEAILDGGPASTGIPSTVLDLTTPVPTVVRKGALGVNALAAVLGGQVAMAEGFACAVAGGTPPR